MRRRDIVATIGSGADLALRNGLQFLVLLVLARILTPADFGNVALVGIFVTMAAVVADLGLTTALIQSKALTALDIASAFWVSVAAGGTLALVGALAARPLSRALGASNLGSLAAFMALAVLFTSLGAVPTALLVKRLQFGRILIVGVVATLLSGAVALVMALNDDGVWALAAQAVVMAGTSALGAWLVVPERPTLGWSTPSARRLLGVGRFVLAATLVDVTYARGVVLLIGSVFGPTPLGYYLRADSTQQIPADAASSILGRVALPVFSEARDDVEGLRSGLRLGIRSATALTAPALAFAGALSGPLVHTLYGAQWAPSARLLTILCLGGMFWPVHVMNINLMYALGEARTVFRIDLFKKTLGAALIIAGAQFGLQGVAWASVVVGLASAGFNGHIVNRLVGFGTAAQFRSISPVIVLSVGVAIPLAVISHMWSADAALKLVLLGLLSCTAYLWLARLLHVSAVSDTLGYLRQLRSGEAT